MSHGARDGESPRRRWRGRIVRLAALVIILVSALALTSGPLPAAARSEMRGTALEAGTRRPITGAVVTLYSRAEDGTHYLTSSDPQGRFLFHSLGRGTYDLEASLPGYRTERKTQLQVRPPFRSIVEVLLNPGFGPDSSSGEGEAGAVSGVAAAAPGSGEGPEIDNDSVLALVLTGPGNEPVPEGLASLVPLSFEGDRLYARSDEEGRVEFAGQQPGRYRLVASAPGYLTVRSERIDLGPGGPSHVMVILTPYPLDFAGNLEDLLPPEEPLLPRRLEIDIPDTPQRELELELPDAPRELEIEQPDAPQPGRTP